MKRILLIMVSVSIVGLAGCNQTDDEKQQEKHADKENVKKNIMGDGTSKLKPGEHLGGI